MTNNPLPVTATKARELERVMRLTPRIRTATSGSERMLAKRSLRRPVALTLSRKRIGEASISSAARRLSSSAMFSPAVKARGRMPKAMARSS